MAFFGLEPNDLFERERQNARQQQGLAHGQEPDLAVYTWGEEGYDGLGDALLEGGDDFNDETFGGSGPVGKDFDFAGRTAGLSLDDHPPVHLSQGFIDPAIASASGPLSFPQARPGLQSGSSARWDDQSAFSILGRMDGGSRATLNRSMPPDQALPIPQSAFSDTRSAFPSQSASAFPPQSGFSLLDDPIQNPQAYGRSPGLARMQVSRSAQDVEDEMRMLAQRQRFEEVTGYAPAPGPGRMQPGRSAQDIEDEMRRQAARQQHLLAQRAQQPSPAGQQRLYQQQQQQQMYGAQAPPSYGHVRAPSDLQQQRAAPPRMHPHSASPRFHQMQQELQINRQQEQYKLQWLNKQLQREEQERRGGSADGTLDPRVADELAALRRHSPAFDPHLQQAALPDNIQMEQLLLRRQANEKFMREMVGHEQVGQRILEAERMEERRRVKGAKLAHMARYNDLMTQSDKDFITRIQVSQLVTQDPYAEDFYAQIYMAVMRSKMGLPEADARVISFASGGGVGVGISNRPNGRRAGAMAKMEAQVEKIVQAARLREKEKVTTTLTHLQGALGKTAGRSYKAAPRQLLQVGGDADGESASKQAARSGMQALNGASDDNDFKREPLTRREALLMLEELYNILVEIETLDRRRPPPEDFEDYGIWNGQRDSLIEQLWDQLHVTVPLEACDPHPFISLLMPSKGKRLLSRLTKYLGERNLLLLTLLVALFPQVDVVAKAPLLDSVEPSDLRTEIEAQTAAWLDAVPSVILAAVTQASLAHISSWFAMLLERTNIVKIASTQPGLTLLTLLMSKADELLRDLASGLPVENSPSPEEVQQWHNVYHEVFQMLAPNFLFLFPSYRITGDTTFAPSLPLGIDARAWTFFAVFAILAPPDDHAALVIGLREKILADLASTRAPSWPGGEEEREARLANLNLFLNSLGLDTSQIQ